MIRLSGSDARRYLLNYHGLDRPRSALESGIAPFVRRVGCLQYDPLDIVGRNADLVLNARIRNYRPGMLYSTTYERRELMDGWDKVMSIHAPEDFPCFTRRRAANEAWLRTRNTEISEAAPAIMEQIRERGPLSSADFDSKKKLDWFWGPARLAKAVLDALQHTGAVVVSRREGTRKYFDLPERVIGSGLAGAPDPFETETEYLAWRVQRRIGGIGLGWPRKSSMWLAIDGLGAPLLREVIDRHRDSGTLAEVEIDGRGPYYARPGDLAVLDRKRPSQPAATVLAPLDNLLWDRKLTEELFGFSYVWEVYKPAAERQFGYYVLPVIYGDRFVARMEARRNGGLLNVIGWWWETDRHSASMRDAIRRAIVSLARMSGLEGVSVAETLGREVSFLNTAD